MVITASLVHGFRPPRRGRQRGALMTELLVALAILMGTLLPLAYAFAAEHRLARACYQRAVALEIVDGEMEGLLAGGGRAFGPGTYDYPVHARAATNLPAGRFILTVQPGKLRLQWRPEPKKHGGSVVREAVFP